MSREQMIAHFILGGWSPTRFYDDYVVIWRGTEACVLSRYPHESVFTVRSSWHNEDNRKHRCSWDAISDHELKQFLELEP